MPPVPTPTHGASEANLLRQLPLRRDEARDGGSAGWVPAAVVLTSLALAGAWLLWRRGVPHVGSVRGASRKEALLAVRLSSQPLTPHTSVHVVRWHGEELLLGCTAQQVNVLARKAVDSSGAAP